MQTILDRVPKRDGRSVMSDARFDGAIFESSARFGPMLFKGATSFRNATFEAEARFEGAGFAGDVDFTGVTFVGAASFSRASFAEALRFDHARFRTDAGFGKATFSGDTTFRHAQFAAATSFRQATFGGDVTFHTARFRRGARFRNVTFSCWSSFSKVIFEDEAAFRNAAFMGEAHFGTATFCARVDFTDVTFRETVRLTAASFEQDASFKGATFSEEVSLEGATFKHDAVFTDATFERAKRFGPALVIGQVALDRSSFLADVQLALSARRLSCVATQFRAGARLRLRWAEIVLDEAHFAQASLLTGSGRFEGIKDKRLARALAGEPASSRPRLLSLRGADVAQLVLADLDLRACRFAGTHNLDQLRLEGDVQFARPPKGPRWTARQTIAEEHQWRIGQVNERRGWAGWRDEAKACVLPQWVTEVVPDDAETLAPRQIASIYRSLRKGREDNKDEPGSADFYYGEMEMRRQRGPRKSPRARDSLTTDRGERAVVWLYWLVSGYGLRASRALVALLVTVLVFAVLFDAWGFEKSTPFTTALLFSAESTTSLLRGTERNLTTLGEGMWIALRLLGPVFFGLALLSLRGRIKR
jgi:uncharacterized protein YjbI with pentapeptide repeats